MNKNDQVVDFEQAREAKLVEKRRKTERIFFKNLISVYCVMGGEKLRAIELVEVSEEGCSFQVPFDTHQPWPKSAQGEIWMRFYFSQDTYLPVRMLIAHSHKAIDEGGTRMIKYGCKADQSITSYPAFVQFVRFLKLYSEHARKDSGQDTLFYL